MSHQNHFLHFHISKKKGLTWLDKSAVVAAFLSPLTGLPQGVQVMKGNVEGVSIMTWIGFTIFNLFFLTYATIHKIKPMQITNGLWLAIDGFVILGLLMHRMLV